MGALFFVEVREAGSVVPALVTSVPYLYPSGHVTKITLVI